MKRIVIALTASALASCVAGPDTSQPTVPIDPDRPQKVLPASGWAQADGPLELAAPREIVIEQGFPHELPEAPRLLTVQATQPWTSGRALAMHDGQLFAVDQDNGMLVVSDAKTGRILRHIELGAMPEDVVVSAEGVAYVSVRGTGEVVAIKRAAHTVSNRTQVGPEPTGLALSPDGATLYVTLRASSELVAMNPKTLGEISRVPTVFRPRTVVASPDGWLAVAGQTSHAVKVDVDPETGAPMPNGGQARALRQENPQDGMLHFGRANVVNSNRARAGTIAPESGNALIVHEQTISGTANDAFAHLFGGEVNNNQKGGGSSSGYGSGEVFSDAPHLIRPMVAAVTTIADSPAWEEPAWPVRDALTREPLTSRIVQPTDINHHPTWTLAFVVGQGSDNVLVLNTAVADPMRSPLGIIRVGHAPRAITFSADGNTAYVLNGHQFTISEIDLTPFFNMELTETVETTGSPNGPNGADSDEFFGPKGFGDVLMTPHDTSADHVAPIRVEHSRVTRIGDDPMPEDMRLGRRIFTYAFNESLAANGFFACASCHFEGGEDGQVWIVPGGERQTPQLAGRLDGTGPFNWLGTENELDTNMDKTIERMGGNGLESAELASLEQFITHGLPRPVNPNVYDSGLTEAQERGRQLFNSAKAACSTCHSGPALTDGKFYDVGTTTKLEREVIMMTKEMGDLDWDAPETLMLNTPGLLDLFATAPYLHDGSASTLMEVLDRTATTMGHTADLTVEQKQDLVEYLKTL